MGADAKSIRARKLPREILEGLRLAGQEAIANEVESEGQGDAKLSAPAFRGRCPSIGFEGLAFFYWIYEISLLEKGATDYHDYQFTRRTDRRKITVNLKTGLSPDDDRSQELYERSLRKLEKSRTSLLVNKRYATLDEIIGR